MESASEVHRGRWVTEKQYGEIHGLSRQTLCNWRYRDQRAGRMAALDGFPNYRYFGSAVRYWLQIDHAR